METITVLLWANPKSNIFVSGHQLEVLLMFHPYGDIQEQLVIITNVQIKQKDGKLSSKPIFKIYPPHRSKILCSREYNLITTNYSRIAIHISPHDIWFTWKNADLMVIWPCFWAITLRKVTLQYFHPHGHSFYASCVILRLFFFNGV